MSFQILSLLVKILENFMNVVRHILGFRGLFCKINQIAVMNDVALIGK